MPCSCEVMELATPARCEHDREIAQDVLDQSQVHLEGRSRAWMLRRVDPGSGAILRPL